MTSSRVPFFAESEKVHAFLRGCGWIALGLYLSIGAIWTALNLRHFPHYGDTGEYLRLSQDLAVDEYRGILYPALLALTAEIFDAADLPESPRWKWEKAGLPCAVPSGFVAVQILQILVAVSCFAYFITTVVHRERRPTRGQVRARYVRSGLLVAVLAVDPLISHYNLSLMTDGLGLALSVLFCAAFADLVRRNRAPWAAGFVLFLAFVSLAGLRVEKKWIMLGTILTVSVLLSFGCRRNLLECPPNLLRRFAVALALGGAGLVGVNAVHNMTYAESTRWPPGETIAHLRLIFPHLTEVYDQLPEHARALISREDAKYYDGHLNNARKLIDRITADDVELRHELTRELAEVVVGLKWPIIGLDIARDTAENLAATFSFAGRLAIWKASPEVFKRWFYSDGTRWIYQRFIFHVPRWSHLHLYFSGALLACATGVALSALYRSLRRGAWQLRSESVAAWGPAVIFCLLNALAFAATQDLVQIRYALISHALVLCLVYNALIRWLLPPVDPAR